MSEDRLRIEELERSLAASENARIASENARIALEGEVQELRQNSMRVMVLNLGIILVLELDICKFNFDSVQLTFFSEKCQRGK